MMNFVILAIPSSLKSNPYPVLALVLCVLNKPLLLRFVLHVTD